MPKYVVLVVLYKDITKANFHEKPPHVANRRLPLLSCVSKPRRCTSKRLRSRDFEKYFVEYLLLVSNLSNVIVFYCILAKMS